MGVSCERRGSMTVGIVVNLSCEFCPPMYVSSLPINWPGKQPDSLLWLASFPRSGNTFMRILLANYFAESDAAYDINKLFDFVPSDTSALLWKRFCGEARPSTLELTWSARPAFIEHYRKSLASSTFPGFKTHTANVEISGRKGFDFRPGDRALYIVRHPLDVLLSYAQFNDWTIDATLDSMLSSGTYVFSEDHGGAFEVRGSWTEHVTSWVLSRPCPVLLVRYEELCAATEEALPGILNFIGAPIIPERIKRAAEASQFHNLRKQDARSRFNESPVTLKSSSFFRRGEALQWLRELTPRQAYRLADGCGEIMQKVGYTHPRNVLFDGRNALQPINLQAGI